jgi:zinc transport system ATP-binding protein
VLTFDEVTVCYGATRAVDAVSLSVGAGEFAVLTGSNGSGKSSLARAALGLVPMAAGRVRIDSGSDGSWGEQRRLIAYVPQRTSVGAFPLPVDDLLASGGDHAAAVEAAEQLGIGGLRDRAVSTLSGGQLQRAYLARAIGQLSAGAQVLLADEPTSALDFAGQEVVADLLAGLEVTRLVISHDIAVVERAGRTLEMAGGRLRERS